MNDLPETQVWPPTGELEIHRTGSKGSVTYIWTGGDIIAINPVFWEKADPGLMQFDAQTLELTVGPFELAVLGYNAEKRCVMAVRAPAEPVV